MNINNSLHRKIRDVLNNLLKLNNRVTPMYCWKIQPSLKKIDFTFLFFNFFILFYIERRRQQLDFVFRISDENWSGTQLLSGFNVEGSGAKPRFRVSDEQKFRVFLINYKIRISKIIKSKNQARQKTAEVLDIDPITLI
ncbi:hypothetical protein BpHYR1_012586 [Brachionus plicatilis]|uniref:Uncharacterized protein n=1 Tax=Brachionus plicatilis TaxID=10195 RepID=A0A3M7T2A6_BRAPC|nr:hypothetical protein BpHYR1_012586 [Brachionus plicatilis]